VAAAQADDPFNGLQASPLQTAAPLRIVYPAKRFADLPVSGVKQTGHGERDLT
jgi:hypothetical protein